MELATLNTGLTIMRIIFLFVTLLITQGNTALAEKEPITFTEKPEETLALPTINLSQQKFVKAPINRQELIFAESDPKKIDVNYNIEDVTGERDVRASAVKMGVDYRVNERSSLGVEASQEFHDSGDASAWNQSVEDETAAGVKYKLAF